MAKKLTVGDMKAALAWLETDAGAHPRAEEVASTSHDMQGLSKFAEGLRGKPLPAQRERLISDLIWATGAVRTAATAAETMAFGIAYGLDSLQPRERRMGEARVRGNIRDAMPADKMQGLFAQQLPLMYAYAYREIPDADLARYLNFLKGLDRQALPGRDERRLHGRALRASIQMGELAGARQRPDLEPLSAAGSSGRPSSRRSPASRATAACRA